MDSKDLLLYAVTDRAWLNGETMASQVKAAIDGGATFVQLREKGLDREGIVEEAKLIKPICNEAGVPFIINDDVSIALEVGADGVHVGQKDMKANKVRELLGPDKIIGVSAKTVELALEAEKNGADYLGVGAAFSTSTKSDASEISFDTIKAICEAVSIPVIAIGGITYDNVDKLEGSGIVGVALVSAIFASDDITKQTKKLYDKVEKLFGR